MQVGSGRAIDSFHHGCFVGHCDVAIDAMDGVSQRGKQRLLGLGRTNNHAKSIVRDLVEGNILDRWRGDIKRALLDVFDYADDFNGLGNNGGGSELLADRIFIRGEKLFCERLVDDRHAGL